MNVYACIVLSTAKIASDAAAESPWIALRIACVVALEMTAAMTIGAKVLSEKSLRSTSRQKKTPAIGALKMDAIPAAAPQPTNVPMWSRFALIFWPTVEPAVAPIWMIGPSAPELPPEPTVKTLASTLMTPTRSGIFPPRLMSATSTCGTPWPLASAAKSVTSIPVMSAPAMGMRGRSQIVHRPCWAVESFSARWRAWSKATAPTAVMAPMNAPMAMRYQSRWKPRRVDQARMRDLVEGLVLGGGICLGNV